MDPHTGHQHGHEAASVGHGEMAPMPMYFMNTFNTILWFQDWETKSKTSYAISILGLVLLAVLHEALNLYRSAYLSSPTVDQSLQEPLVGVGNPRIVQARHGPHERFVASALYTLNVVTGYMLMLAVMTFNVGYFFAVVLGMGFGYWLLFDRSLPVGMARTDSCHPRHDSRA